MGLKEFSLVGDFVGHAEFLTLIVSFQSKRNINKLACDLIVILLFLTYPPRMGCLSTFGKFNSQKVVSILNLSP